MLAFSIFQSDTIVALRHSVYRLYAYQVVHLKRWHARHPWNLFYIELVRQNGI